VALPCRAVLEEREMNHREILEAAGLTEYEVTGGKLK